MTHNQRDSPPCYACCGVCRFASDDFWRHDLTLSDRELILPHFQGWPEFAPGQTWTIDAQHELIAASDARRSMQWLEGSTHLYNRLVNEHGGNHWHFDVLCDEEGGQLTVAFCETTISLQFGASPFVAFGVDSTGEFEEQTMQRTDSKKSLVSGGLALGVRHRLKFTTFWYEPYQNVIEFRIDGALISTWIFIDREFGNSEPTGQIHVPFLKMWNFADFDDQAPNNPIKFVRDYAAESLTLTTIKVYDFCLNQTLAQDPVPPLFDNLSHCDPNPDFPIEYLRVADSLTTPPDLQVVVSGCVEPTFDITHTLTWHAARYWVADYSIGTYIATQGQFELSLIQVRIDFKGEEVRFTMSFDVNYTPTQYHFLRDGQWADRYQTTSPALHTHDTCDEIRWSHANLNVPGGSSVSTASIYYDQIFGSGISFSLTQT